MLLMMAGTSCLFTAGSAALLKHLRSRPGYSCQTRHFIGVSGLLYRMKRNAVGLANICILASMVLMTVSGTLRLYLGIGGVAAARAVRRDSPRPSGTP